MKPHKSSSGRMIRNYDDLFEDVMEFIEKRVGKEDFINDADLRAWILDNDSNDAMTSSLLDELQKTVSWKKKIDAGKRNDAKEMERKNIHDTTKGERAEREKTGIYRGLDTGQFVNKDSIKRR